MGGVCLCIVVLFRSKIGHSRDLCSTRLLGGDTITETPRRAVSSIAYLNEDHEGEPNVALLAKHVQARLADLRLSTLAASKQGIVSRSTLHSLNKPGSRVPSFVTLAKFDELLSWVPGSAHAALYGKEPVTREYATANPETALDEGALDSIYFEMAKDDQSAYHYDELKRLVTERLAELGISKQRFHQIGGPGRSTMATLGSRGYAPSAETLHRIDTFANWEPGSALEVLRGGKPTPCGMPLRTHRAVVPLNAAFDLLLQAKARLQRQGDSVQLLLSDVDRVMEQVSVVISDLEDPRHYPNPEAADTGEA